MLTGDDATVYARSGLSDSQRMSTNGNGIVTSNGRVLKNNNMIDAQHTNLDDDDDEPNFEYIPVDASPVINLVLFYSRNRF